MKFHPILTLICACIHTCFAQISSTPVIGILTLHTSSKFDYPIGSTYVYSSYTKWIEESEMRWIPISVFDSVDVVARKLELVNGVLLTGGNEVMGTKNMPSAYAGIVAQILDYARAQNDHGVVYPVFGTCMGFQSMLVVLSDYELKLESVHNVNHSEGLKLTPNAQHSFLSLYFNDNELSSLDAQKLFYFHHNDGFSMQQINASPYATNNLRILASVTTPKSLEILAAVQHKTYPFIAVQFHPEKTQFEYSDAADINKSDYAVKVNAGFSKVFRQLIGDVRAKLTTKQVLAYRVDAVLDVEYGAADEAFVFKPGTGSGKEVKGESEAADETTPE